MTLPQNEAAFDLGVGTGVEVPGVGFNAEARYGLADRFEIGARAGFSSAAQGPPSSISSTPRADFDDAARLFDRMTFDDGPDHFTNPELRIRGAILRDAVGEMALEARFVVPMSKLSGAGLAFGVPFALHFGDRVRIDAGAYEVAVLSHNAEVLTEGLQTISVPTVVSLQVPLAIWVQIVPRFWCGPFASLTHYFTASPVPGSMAAAVSFPPSLVSSVGLGFGYQIGDALDLKASVMNLNRDEATTTINLGVEWRIQ
jgi:hypothetical protein